MSRSVSQCEVRQLVSDRSGSVGGVKSAQRVRHVVAPRDCEAELFVLTSYIGEHRPGHVLSLPSK